jgi:hypothetical protein
VIRMAIGVTNAGSVPSTAPGPGPRDASAQVGKHVAGSGTHPGTGPACSTPTPQHPGNVHRPLP